MGGRDVRQDVATDDETARRRIVKSLSNVEQLRTACETCSVSSGHGALVSALKDLMPGMDFAVTHERAGWHRIGGVMLRDGTRISENLRNWAETELAEIGPDTALPENSEDYLATRFDGRTLYLTAPTGPQPWDFVQVELEVVQEVIDRVLFPDDFVAGDIEDFLDPRGAKRLVPDPVGGEHYRFRSVHHIAHLIAELDTSIHTNRRFARFLEDWSNSRAGNYARFCDHWVLRMFRYVDRFGEQKLEATPISLGKIERISLGEECPAGGNLARLFAEFDKATGYPMAWYFHMLTSQKDLHVIAEQAYRDHRDNEFAYLPERDFAVIRAWHREPYCF